jgi:hypothetical protein
MFTLVAQNARVDASVARDVGVAHARCYHLDEELVCLRLAREHVFPLPVVLGVGYYALAGHCVFHHSSLSSSRRAGVELEMQSACSVQLILGYIALRSVDWFYYTAATCAARRVAD